LAGLRVFRRADRSGDVFSRPTAGGGGFGDPLERDPALVLEDVADDYVSDRARRPRTMASCSRSSTPKFAAYAVDEAATKATREAIRRQRSRWLATDPRRSRPAIAPVEIDQLDVVRRHAVVLDWTPGRCCPVSTDSSGRCFISARGDMGEKRSAETPASSDV